MKRLFEYFFQKTKYLKIIKKIIMKKPFLILRIIGNYFRSTVLKEKIARKVEIGVSFSCQCSCQKCSSVPMDNSEKKKLSLGEIRRVAAEIINVGAIHINFTGGEALLEKNIFEIIKCFKPNKTIISINSNGILLDKEMIDKLEAAGVDIIKVSIDSPVKEEHDQSRGFSGCFEQSLKALAYIKGKPGILGHISTVCSKEILNTDKIWRILEIADKYHALLGLTVPTSSGRWLGNEDVLLGENEKEVLKRLSKMPNVVRDIDESYKSTQCPAGSEEFYLTCYGDVIPCPFIQISFGNVREKSIKEIWGKMSDFREYKYNARPGCLAGENREFIRKYLLPLKDCKDLPISYEKHPARLDKK